MPKTNKWPGDICSNPNPQKTLEELWDEMDGYTYEAQFEREENYDGVNFVIPFPPLKYKGKVLKGVFFSQSVDLIVERFPRIKEIFFPIANSMTFAYPQSIHADLYFVCYQNALRELYWKNKHPERKHIIMLPLQDADFTHEYDYAPTFNTPKDTDIFCVTTCYPFKRVPVFARALKAYEAKYGKRLSVKYALGMGGVKKNPDGSIDYSELRDDAKEQMQEVEQILGNIKDYIDFIPALDAKDLPRYYTAARCGVLCSLGEGKNRFIYESMSCDTPIIVFEDFNKYARAGSPVFYENAGEYVPEYTPKALADTIHKVLSNQSEYEPRKCFLKYFGRKNFLNKVIDSIPYYRENLPDYKKGDIMNNIWADLAVQTNYQLSLNEFLYGKNLAIHKLRGMGQIKPILEFFFARFNIR